MNTKFSLANYSFVFLLVALQLVLLPAVQAQKFTIPVLPDTQCEVNYNPVLFTSQLQWIVAKKDSLHVPIVLHVGDVVDFNNTTQYQRASDGFQILDKARIPYAIAIGNHDTNAVGENSGSAAPGNVNANLRTTERFNSYFPVKRFVNQKGRFEKNKSDNALYTFKAGGLKWLVLTLEFCARQEAVDWANKVLPKYHDYNVIILTHYFLNGKGEIAPNNAGYGNLTLQSIYDQLVKKHANIRMVICGHTGSSTWRDDVGDHGNHIYQILQDYQGDDNGGGYIRLLDIDPQAGTISAKMYSPFYNKTRDDASAFSFSGVKFVGK